MLINNNLTLLNTLNKNNNKIQKSTEKSSSGLRINKASDDSAGLAISEKMRAQIRGLDQAQRNTQDGISLIQTSEGGLGQINEYLQRIRELAVQASNDTYTAEDRQSIQEEVDQLKQGIDSIANNTEFNGIKLLNKAKTTNIPFSPTVETIPLTGGQVTVKITSPLGNTPTQTVSNLINTLNNVKDGSIGDSDAQRMASSFTAIQQNGSDFLIYNNKGYGYGAGANDLVSQGLSNNIQDLGFVTVGSIQYDGYRFDNQVSSRDTITFSEISNNSTYEVYGNFQLTFAPSQQITENDINVNLQIGSNSGDLFSCELSDVRTSALNINNLSVDSNTDAESSITLVDNAIQKVSAEQGKYGSYQNRLEYVTNNLSNYEENLSKAESSIRDVDMAKQMMLMTKENILSQSSQAMLAQASQQQSQQVLQLLKQ